MELYLEGHRRLRVPMKSLLRNAVRTIYNQPITINVEPCGSGDDAIKRCVKDAGAILLIDSDREVSRELTDRVSAQIGNANLAFFMVQLMEAWFLADHQTLATYYGRGFNANSLRDTTYVENIRKRDVEDDLRNATRQTRKGQYHKGNHAPDLLQRLNPTTVYSACPNFALLIDHLREHSAA